MEEFAEPVRQQSMAAWILASLGLKYLLLLSLATLMSFATTLLLVLRGRGAAMAVALVFLVPLPFFVGVYGVVDGTMSSFMVVATSDVQVKASEVAEGISVSLVTIWAGMLLTLPSFLVATIGLVARSLRSDPERLL